MLLKIMDRIHQEEEKTKQKDKEEGMEEKRKEEVKLQCLKNSLLE
jgi:hypothetical protein